MWKYTYTSSHRGFAPICPFPDNPFIGEVRSTLGLRCALRKPQGLENNINSCKSARAGLQHSLWAAAKTSTYTVNTEKATEGQTAVSAADVESTGGTLKWAVILLHSPGIPGVSGDLPRAPGVLLHNHRHNPGTSQFWWALWVPAYGCWQTALHPGGHREKDRETRAQPLVSC